MWKQICKVDLSHGQAIPIQSALLLDILRSFTYDKGLEEKNNG